MVAEHEYLLECFQPEVEQTRTGSKLFIIFARAILKLMKS